MPIRTRASLWMDADIDSVFSAVTEPASIAAAFSGLGPIPGIERIDNPSGGAFAVGLERIIVNADGTTIREMMTRVDPPAGQSYELSDFTGPFRFLVKSAGGNWTLNETDGGTQVTWEFRFDAYALAWPVVRILAPVFERAQLRSLRNTATAIKR